MFYEIERAVMYLQIKAGLEKYISFIEIKFNKPSYHIETLFRDIFYCFPQRKALSKPLLCVSY